MKPLSLLRAARPSTRVAAGVALLGCLAAPLIAATPADASPYPVAPHSIYVAGATHSSITVGAAHSLNALSYRLWVSTTKTDLYYYQLTHNIHSSALRSVWSTHPYLTITGMTFSTAPVYFRLEANNGTRHSYAANVWTTGLAPSTPTSLARTPSGATQDTLTWTNVSGSTGFTVAQATNPAMTIYRRTYSMGAAAGQFTPYAVAAGRTYFFQIRAMNHGIPSAYSAPIAMTVVKHQQPIRVMTYNILANQFDGTYEAGNRITSWTYRGPAAAALINHVDPDVLAVQEGNDSIPGTHWRQVDSLNSRLRALGRGYAVAHTEVTYAQMLAGTPGYWRTGDYILYKTWKYTAYGAGGHFSIGDDRWAAYQELRNRVTGAKVLVVCAHPHATAGAYWDLKREAETRVLVSTATAMGTARGVPVIYAGDFNSTPLAKTTTVDGPGYIMRNWHVNDSAAVSPYLTNPQYDSMNEYRRTPYAYGLRIDYVWTGAGVATTSWGQAVNMSGGSYIGTIPSDHNPIYANLTYKY